MSLLQEWREYAYSEEMQNSKEGESFGTITSSWKKAFMKNF